VASSYDVVGDVRGKGLMIGVEFVTPGSGDLRQPSPRAATRVLEEARAGGLLVGKGGLYGNVLRIAPPLTLTDAECEDGLRILSDALVTADAEVRA